MTPSPFPPKQQVSSSARARRPAVGIAVWIGGRRLRVLRSLPFGICNRAVVASHAARAAGWAISHDTTETGGIDGSVLQCQHMAELMSYYVGERIARLSVRL